MDETTAASWTRMPMMMIFEGGMRRVVEAYRMAVYVVVWKPVLSRGLVRFGHVPSDKKIQAKSNVNKFGRRRISLGAIIRPTLFHAVTRNPRPDSRCTK